MNANQTFPRIKTVEALPDYHLLVTFRNGEKRVYDFRPKLTLETFRMLRNEAFFCAVKTDPHGYGIIWNDDLDLAESELWLNGKPFANRPTPELLTV